MCPPHSRPYQLEYASDAWKDVSLLAAEEFNEVRRVLQALAEHVSPEPAEGASPEARSVQVGVLRVHYVLEPAREVLVLLGVKRGPAPGEVSP